MTKIQTVSILGCGWLGYPLARNLVQKGYWVKGSTTNVHKQEKLEKGGIEPFLIDFNEVVNEKRLHKFLDSDLLVLNIPPSKVQGEQGDYVDRIRLVAVAAAQCRVKKIILISSTSVYPKNNAEVDETTLLHPKNKNGRALLEAENALHNHPYFQTTVLRMGGLIGYDRLPHKFLAFTANPKNAMDRLNLIHRDDAIGAIKVIIEKQVWNETFNVVADEHPTKQEYYEQAAELLNAYPPEMTTDETPNFKIVKNDKIKEALGFHLQYPDPVRFLEVSLASK